MTLIIKLVFLFLFTASPILAQTMGDEERRLIELINEVRRNPRHFLKEAVKPFFHQQGIDPAHNKYAASLIANLRKQRKAPPVTQDPYLTDQARLFATDMGESGAIGHTSKKRGALSSRLKKYRNKYIGEKCSYGYSGAIDILMQLLIDEDVPSLGHRKNILNRNSPGSVLLSRDIRSTPGIASWILATELIWSV